MVHCPLEDELGTVPDGLTRAQIVLFLRGLRVLHGRQWWPVYDAAFDTVGAIDQQGHGLPGEPNTAFGWWVIAPDHLVRHRVHRCSHFLLCPHAEEALERGFVIL